MKELNQIQTELVCKKDQRNTFGNYSYRSLEDIMEAVRPLLKKTKATITFTDDLVLVGDRYYIKSTCTIKNETGECETSTAWAREQEQKKGMDDAQVTGSASSYARKYAACSLLGISNGDDPDAMDNTGEGQKAPRTGANRASGASTRPLETKGAEGAKPRVTMTQFEEGRCKKLIAYLAGYDYNDLAAWEAGCNMLQTKYDFDLGVLEAIELAAKNTRNTSKK